MTAARTSGTRPVTPLSCPPSTAGLAIGILYALGIIVLAYLYTRHPERLPEMRQVFADEPVAAASEPAVSAEGA